MKEVVLMICLVTVFNGLVVVVADFVPVILWGPHIPHESAVALKSHDGAEFMDILKKHYTENTIIFVMAEDQLSVEDLSQCKSPNGLICFNGIQRLKTKLYLPKVEDPASVIEDVSELHTIEVSLLSSGNFSEPLNPQPGQYIFVNFDDDDYIGETKPMKLTRHDRMIMKSYQELLLQNDRNFIVILTGKRASHHARFAREAYPHFSYHEEMNSSSVGFTWKKESILLYYLSMDLEESSGSKSMDVLLVTSLKMSETELDVMMLVNSNETFEFRLTIEHGYWRANNFKWKSEPLFSDKLISAADGFSYHCTPAIKISNNKTNNNNVIIVKWKGLQLQPNFDNVTGKSLTSFSDAYDCVGFVSPVILCGLLVAFMLLFVVFAGVLCLLNIKSNDRFEIPNAKTITVIVDG